MRWLLVLVAGCGFRIGVGAQDGAIADDVAGDDDGSIVIDTPLPDCDAPPHWAASFTPTRTLHVDPLAVAGGTPPDGSATNPFMTISAAAAAATPGTRILLAPRSYGTVTLTDLHGSATAPIWIEGPVTAPRATFTGTNAIHLVRPQYVVLQHLDFTSLSGDAINADDGGQSMFGAAHHLAMVDIKSTSVNTTFQLTGVTDVAIYDSTLVSGSRGVQLVGVHRAVVARLAMTSLSYSSFQAAGGSRDIVLRQSRITTDGNRAVRPPADLSLPHHRSSSGDGSVRRFDALHCFARDPFFLPRRPIPMERGPSGRGACDPFRWDGPDAIARSGGRRRERL